MANFDQVFAHGTTPQKKHLLHRVVKEVRVHDRVTVEAFYAVPNHDAVRTLGQMAPLQPQYANRMRMPELPLSIRSWPVPIRRRRLRDSIRRGLALRVGASGGDSEIVLIVPRQQPLGSRSCGRLSGHIRKALVWRALLAARAIAPEPRLRDGRESAGQGSRRSSDSFSSRPSSIDFAPTPTSWHHRPPGMGRDREPAAQPAWTRNAAT
jgi:hypothetical protein